MLFVMSSSSAEPRTAAVGTTAVAADGSATGSVPGASGTDARLTARAEAMARARATGQQVEVVPDRDAYSQNWANPDGTYTMTMAVSPQRGRAADGSMQPIDTRLERRGDGWVGPRVPGAPVAFSGGGDGRRMVLVECEGHRLELGWPGRLPSPVLDGDAAVYREVLPGADLRLTATADGFREVLVVKTPAAARSAVVRSLRFSMSSDDLRIVGTASGGAQALDADGNVVFSSPAAVMWDSQGDAAPGTTTPPADPTATADPPPTAGPTTAAGATPSTTVTGPATSTPAEQEPVDQQVDPLTRQRNLVSDGAVREEGTAPDADDASAVLPMTVSATAVTVTPDTELLTGADTVYPVYIDPSFGISRSEWTMVSSAHDPKWKYTDDEGMGYCGTYLGYWCGSGFKKRLFFEFTGSRLVGKEVLDATFAVTEVWSMSCEASWVDLERVDGGISSSTKWPGPASVDQMGDRKVAYGRGSACSPSVPAQPVEFNDNPDETDENLTSTVNAFAHGKWSTLTLMLRAKDETDPNGWKRFKNNAALTVVYVPIPDKPKSLGIRPTKAPETACSTSSTNPTIVDSKTPVVQAAPKVTAVASGDPVQSLAVEFNVHKLDPTAKTWSSAWTDTKPDSGWVSDGTKLPATTTALTDGGTYRLRARTRSHWSYGGSSGDRYSAYAGWCYFTVDASAPKPPVITSTGPYQLCLTDDCPAAGGPGQAGTFSLAPATSSTDIVKYEWWLAGDGTGTAWTTVTGKTATISVKPPLAGTYVLWARAWDSLHPGPQTSFKFRVAAPEGPVGVWHFAESSGTTAADSAGSGAAKPLTLAGGAAFDGRGRRGNLPPEQPADRALALNGTSAYATSAGPLVSPTNSFTASAWAYLRPGSTRNMVVFGQSATDAVRTGFNLYYSISAEKWILCWHSVDPTTGSTTIVRSYADIKNPALEVWTHLAAVYDAGQKGKETIQLFVNGRPQGTPVTLTGITLTATPGAAGVFQVGRASTNNASFTDYANGLVDEVHLWQRVLTPEELAVDAALLSADGNPATALTGSWAADVGTTDGATSIPDTSAYARGALERSSAGTALDVASGLVTFDGAAGSLTGTGPVVDETGSFTVSVAASIDSAALATKPAGYRAQVAGQRSGVDGAESSWGLWYEQAAVSDGVPVGRWVFGRTGVDGSGTAATSTKALSEELAGLDVMVQLTGVYDARDRSVHLYVGPLCQDDGTGVATFAADQQGSGELSVGRGRRAGAWGDALPGAVASVRVWAGAMNDFEVGDQAVAGL
ncbi:MAG: LamG domain-containing protein [Actinomycetales bacterium]|nr:LamG domain-containing protein [Actinomycetales bacterium]